MNILVLTNEPLQKMALGSNTSLSYILAAVQAGHQVFIHQISDKISSKMQVVCLNNHNASQLILQYKKSNLDLANKIYISENFAQKEIAADEIDLVIQRLEPMKWPFAPAGKISVAEILTQIKKLFPNKIFNLPLDVFKDKEFPLLFDFATPTATSFAGDEEILHKVKKFSAQKIVFKPSDSAQAFGVFAIEFKNDGYDLADLNEKQIAELSLTQNYAIKTGVASSEFIKIIDILCYVQFYKTLQKKIDAKINNIAAEKIKIGVKSLYGDEILLQPFLVGVGLGDVRINLAKLDDKNFHVVGAVFRKNIVHDEKNFTTGFMSGRSMPKPIEECLTIAEQKNLSTQITKILQKLNGDLQEKYRDIVEIGCDFILAGNGTDLFFGEANHHCQGLIPLTEVTLKDRSKNDFYRQINGLEFEYDGGLAIATNIIKAWEKLN